MNRSIVHEAVPSIENERSNGSFWDLKRINPVRSIVCFSLGAAIGLAVAGYGLFTAKGTVTHTVPPENVALVNQRPILRTDFIAQTETETSKAFAETTLAERLKVLNEMVREELFVQRGLELDFPGTDPDTRTALVNAVEQQLVADVTTHQPTDRELRTYFEAHRANYATEGIMFLHHLLLPKGEVSDDNALATARRAVAALRAGRSLDEIDRMYGLREILPEHSGEAQFYFAQKMHLGDALFARAVMLGDGDVSEPIAAKDGFHFVQMVKNTRPLPLTFERARSQVLNNYITEAKQRLEDADERYLRDKAEILIADDYAEAYEKAHAGDSAQGSKQTPSTTQPASP